MPVNTVKRSPAPARSAAAAVLRRPVMAVPKAPPKPAKAPPVPATMSAKVDLAKAALNAAAVADALAAALPRLVAGFVALAPGALVPQPALAAWQAVKRIASAAEKTDTSIKDVLRVSKAKAEDGDLILNYAPSDKRTPAWKAEAIRQAAEVHRLRYEVKMFRATLKVNGVNPGTVDVNNPDVFDEDAYAGAVLAATDPSDKLGVQVVSLA